GRRNLSKMLDKRILRARSDEHDILTLLMCAQLLHLQPTAGHERPSLYPHVLLLEAMRSANANWFAVLAFLCARFFGIPAPLGNAVRMVLSQHLPSAGQLLPLPAGSGLDSSYVERARRGLQLRSTVALLLSFQLLGDSYANKDTLA